MWTLDRPLCDPFRISFFNVVRLNNGTYSRFYHEVIILLLDLIVEEFDPEGSHTKSMR